MMDVFYEFIQINIAYISQQCAWKWESQVIHIGEISPFDSLRLSNAYMCVVKLTAIGSNNGVSPGRRQVIIWTNAWL